MRLIVEIDERYSGALTLSAVGSSAWQTYITTTAVDLSKYNHISVGEDGKWEVKYCAKEGEENAAD